MLLCQKKNIQKMSSIISIDKWNSVYVPRSPFFTLANPAMKCHWLLTASSFPLLLMFTIFIFLFRHKYVLLRTIWPAPGNQYLLPFPSPSKVCCLSVCWPTTTTYMVYSFSEMLRYLSWELKPYWVSLLVNCFEWNDDRPVCTWVSLKMIVMF